MNTELQLYERIPDKYIKHSKNFDNLTYLSIQDKVNSDPEFEEYYMNKLINEGLVKLKNNEDILKFPPGETFKYRLNGNSLPNANEGTFRSGGFLIGKKENSEEYILYKAFNGCIFSLQIKDIQEVYVKDKNKIFIKFNYPEKITNYPVYLQNPITNERVVVYYARSPSAQERFKNSLKYKTALNTLNWGFR